MRIQILAKPRSFQERLSDEACALEDEIRELPPGLQREEAQLKRHQIDTAFHIEAWLQSSVLKPLKRMPMKSRDHTFMSPTRTHAADALQRAQKLLVDSARNDLRQLALALLRLDARRPFRAVR